MALWTDIVDPAELTAFSRVAHEALDTSVLTQILPNLYQDEVKFTWREGEIIADVAEYGEFDTEATIGIGDRGQEKMARLIPVSRKLPLSEYEQVTEPDKVRAKADEKADKVVRAIINRLQRARAEALVDGVLNINENKVVQLVDFGRNATQTNAAPATIWSGTGPDPIADLRGWADAVSDASGVEVDTLVGSSRIATALAGILEAAGYISGTGPVVSRNAMNEVLQAYELPRFTVFDGRVAAQRLIADDKLIMAASGGDAGRTVFAPTVESKDARFNLAPGGEPGIVAGLYREDDPPIGWVLGKAVALPILSNPNATLSADVL